MIRSPYVLAITPIESSYAVILRSISRLTQLLLHFGSRNGTPSDTKGRSLYPHNWYQKTVYGVSMRSEANLFLAWFVAHYNSSRIEHSYKVLTPLSWYTVLIGYVVASGWAHSVSIQHPWCARWESRWQKVRAHDL